MNDSPQIEEVSTPLVETRREKWTTFLIFVGASILEASVLTFGNLIFEKWRDWIIVGGTLFFPVLAAIFWESLRSNWSASDSDRVTAMNTYWRSPSKVAGSVRHAIRRRCRCLARCLRSRSWRSCRIVISPSRFLRCCGRTFDFTEDC